MKTFLVLYFLICSFTVTSQHALFTQEGLSSEYGINCIIEDQNGFLWLGTDQGLVYFNGYEDIIVGENAPYYSLFFHEGIIYAGRDSGRVSIINPETKSFLEEFELNISSKITGIIPSNEQLIISTYGHGMYRRSGESVQKIQQKISDYIYEIIGSEDLVFAATDRGLLKIDHEGSILSTHTTFRDPIITDLTLEGDTTLLLGSYSGMISRLNVKENDVSLIHEGLPGSSLIDLFYFDGKLIVSMSEGIYDVSNPKYPYKLNDPTTSSNLSGVLYGDRRHNLWVSDKVKGLWKTNLNVTVLSGVPKNIQSIAYAGNKLIMGTADGVYSINVFNGQQKNLLPDINATVVKFINDHIFIGSYAKGLFVLDEKLIPILHFDQINGLSNNTVLDLEKIGENTLLISTLAGVSKLTFDFKYGNYIQQDSTYSPLQGYSYVMDIFVHSNGDLWYGRDRNGFLVQSNSKIREYKVLIDDQKLGTVFSIVENGKGEVFLSTSRLGIIKWQNQNIQTIKGQKNAKDPYVSLIPMNKNELLGLRKNAVDKLFIYDTTLIAQNLGSVSNGIAPFINNYYKYDDLVWFVFNDEVYKYTDIDDKKVAFPTATIESIEVNLAKIPLTKNKFNQSKNNLSFKFTGNWMKNPALQKYAYKMEGLDQEWRYTHDRSVSYPQLAPGDYTFKVKASYNDNFDHSPETSYSFHISRHFYNTWWFYGLGFLAILSAVYFYSKKRNREKLIKAELSQKKIETQLINLKNQLNPHFLFNSFNTLMGLIEENSEKSISYIECLTDFYRSILDIGKAELIPFDKEIELVKLYAYLLKERFGDGFNLYFGKSNPDFLVPPLTIQMLVENAVKHNVVNPQRPLKINIDVLDDKIVVFNNLNPKINKVESTKIGLNNIKKRYLLLAGKSIEVSMTNNAFSVTLPAIKASEIQYRQSI